MRSTIGLSSRSLTAMSARPKTFPSWAFPSISKRRSISDITANATDLGLAFRGMPFTMSANFLLAWAQHLWSLTFGLDFRSLSYPA